MQAIIRGMDGQQGPAVWHRELNPVSYDKPWQKSMKENVYVCKLNCFAIQQKLIQHGKSATLQFVKSVSFLQRLSHQYTVLSILKNRLTLYILTSLSIYYSNFHFCLQQPPRLSLFQSLSFHFLVNILHPYIEILWSKSSAAYSRLNPLFSS